MIRKVMGILNPSVKDSFGEVSFIPREISSTELLGKEQMKSLFISAGHDDVDKGAYGNGYYESDIVLEFRDLLKSYIQGRMPEFEVSTDGEKGVNLPLTIASYKASKHDVAIEFHCNAFSNPRVSGVEVLGYHENKVLGDMICEATSRVLGIRNRGYKPENAGQHSRLAFVSDGGGIIHELFFITNKDDIESYQKNKMNLVEVIGDLLIDYCCNET